MRTLQRSGGRPRGAEIPFDNTLDRVTGSHPKVMITFWKRPAKCSNCRRMGLEKMLIERA
jgi:hypothetical protein